MLRVTVTYLLTFVLLICPYFCMGEEAECAVTHRSAIGCSCGDKPCDADNEAPQSPEDADADCLCHGAIFHGAKVEGADCRFSLPAIELVDLDVHAPYASRPRSDDFLHVGHFPPLSTGRGVCGLICSLLL